MLSFFDYSPGWERLEYKAVETTIGDKTSLDVVRPGMQGIVIVHRD